MSSKRIYIGKYLLLVALLRAGGIVAAVWHFTQEKRDEVRIQKLLYALADDLSKNPTESAATALLKVKAVTGAFAEPLLLSMDNYAQGSFDRERLLANVSRYRTMIAQAQVTIDDVNIKISGGNVGESAQKTASIYGGGYGSGTTITGNTNITMTGGSINGNLFGGGNQGVVNSNATVTITGGTVTGNVYGGGNQAEVTGTTKVVVGQDVVE